MSRPQPRHKQSKHKAPRAALVRRPVVLATLGTLALAGIAGGGTAVALMGADDTRPAAASTGTTSDATASAPSSTAAPLGKPAEVIDVGEVEETRGLGSVRPDSWERIPQSALAAYQRSAGVLAEADRKCHVEWTVLAAVGRVLTDHGERRDHEIDDEGLVRPAIVGKALRDRKGRKVEDTDAGQLDGDRRHDHAVGPMLLDPTTWSSVGVDGDNDGDRDPQDMDDAALSIAVLLCSGREDLRDPAELRTALERVNADSAFVAAAVAIDAAYREDLDGEDPVVIEPDPSVVEEVSNGPRTEKTDEPRDDKTPKDDDKGDDDAGWSDGPSEDPTDEPSETDSGSPSPTPSSSGTPDGQPTGPDASSPGSSSSTTSASATASSSSATSPTEPASSSLASVATLSATP